MKYCLSIIALPILVLCASATLVPQQASAQEAILAEIYGRGVHAYYAGQYDQAHELFSSAINAGTKDPRAYYFRGIVSTMRGSSYEAESDWQQGAQLEASGARTVSIGRSLSRFQGSGRLKLEQIRQTVRLQSLIKAASGMSAPNAAAPGVSAQRRSVPSAATAGVAPPPTPPAAENPFKDDAPLTAGQANVQADDALKGTLDPLPDSGMADVAAGAEPAADGGGVFGGATDAPAADPFGGGAAGDAPAADPFGGGGDMADPFGGGGDPFGN